MKKPFDTVDHQILLKTYGVKKNIQHMVKNYLHVVSINGTESKRTQMLCGVPQGSVLSPLLFLLFINYLPEATAFLTLLFADETTFQVSGVHLDQLLTLQTLSGKSICMV